jgi:DNA-binding response OmpR family regulator
MHILIVEDKVGIVQFLKQGSEEEGFEVTTTFDGIQGFAVVQSMSFDFVLLDWMLPKMSGLDLCKAIRIKDIVQETVEGLKAATNNYIKKPFSFEELIERIKVHFRKEKYEDIYKLGTILIDLAKHTVTVSKK